MKKLILRFLGWFTIEITTGLFMLGMAFFLVLRPFALAWETLERVSGITVTFTISHVALVVFGIVLIHTRKVTWYVYFIMISPIWGYSTALSAVFWGGPAVGPWGCGLGLLASGLLLYIHSLRPRLTKLEKHKQEGET